MIKDGMHDTYVEEIIIQQGECATKHFDTKIIYTLPIRMSSDFLILKLQPNGLSFFMHKLK